MDPLGLGNWKALMVVGSSSESEIERWKFEIGKDEPSYGGLGFGKQSKEM